MLTTAVKTLFNTHLDHARVNMQVAHGLIEEVSLLCGKSVKDMLNRNVILVATTRLVQRMLKDALAAVAKFIFICP
jgi:hypothetical protein